MTIPFFTLHPSLFIRPHLKTWSTMETHAALVSLLLHHHFVPSYLIGPAFTVPTSSIVTHVEYSLTPFPL